MPDEHKLINAKARGLRADALLNDDMLKEAFAYFEKRFIEEWSMTQVRDVEARERLWTAVNLNRKYQDYLKVVIRDGKLAQAELNQLSGLNKAA